MNAIARQLIFWFLRKYREPSTWIPITSALGAYLHIKFSGDLQNAIDGIFGAIVAALFVALNERIGPNPENASLPADRAGAANPVVQQPPTAQGYQPARVQPGAPTDLRPHAVTVDDGSPNHPPVRPGFNPRA